uniref:Phytanoyl-CoA dioxygenase n=1 Tax=Lotharella oceanica TaxID=641309 RepID=A0A7S2TLU8_9EUKA|mmetsp:Transcript_18730/g.35354  ORF Transcript_18730/g.35354 Transcript_18730/m.35354 type:complete len:243 (+) Transcript_18730:263-991(+)
MQLEQDGFVVLRGVLSPDAVKAAQARLASELDAAIRKGDEKSFARINNRKRRHDLRLSMAPGNRRLLEAILHSSKATAQTYVGVLGRGATLVEFGVITSHPGAEAQDIHSDVEFDGDARCVFTTFVALQDISEDMGPTNIWPGTHQAFFCEFYKPRMLGPRDPYYWKNKPKLMTVNAGDAVLMDTRVMHCGGANSSKRERMLFHFSFETSGVDKNAPSGFTYNLVPELKGKYQLSHFLERKT